MPTISAFVIDCADPDRLAEFYRAATGWDVTYRDDTFVQLGEGPIKVGFQRVDGYRPPGWPDPAKQAHLDIATEDRDHLEKELITLGATRPTFQPGGDEWLVLIDPAGHPFCLVGAS